MRLFLGTASRSIHAASPPLSGAGRSFLVPCFLFLVLHLSLSCGYRPVARISLPGDVTSVLVIPADVTRTDEPALGPMLTSELTRQLSRRGVAAAAVGTAQARLSARVISLEPGGVPLVVAAKRSLAGQELVLRLELRLATSAGETLWRSGLLEARQLRVRDTASAASDQASRQQTIRAVASTAAREAVEALASGL